MTKSHITLYDLFIFIGITIGFVENNIQVPENITDGAKLCVNVTIGILGRSTVGNILFEDGTAKSEYKIFIIVDPQLSTTLCYQPDNHQYLTMYCTYT